MAYTVNFTNRSTENIITVDDNSINNSDTSIPLIGRNESVMDKPLLKTLYTY